MKYKICKFGGTSISNEKRCQYALNIVKKMSEEHKVIVVISAMGRMNDPYATDTLASLGNVYLSEQEKARLLSVGELISSICFCGKLREMGLNAYALSFRESGILTDDNYECANITKLDNSEIIKLLDSYDVLI
ncbi:MAG: aspartate kinase, partial [Traorella sp.]